MTTKIRHDITPIRRAGAAALMYPARKADIGLMPAPSPLPEPASRQERLIGFHGLPSGDERISVLIEVKQQPLVLDTRLRQFKGAGTQIGHIPPRPMPRPDLTFSAEALARVVSQLQDMHLSQPPVVLHDARTVGAELTLAQLEQVLALPDVAAIRPSQIHRTSR